MTDASTSRARGSDVRIRLLSAARSLLDNGGTDSVTIRESARRAGVSHAAPANHFTDRRALLTALAAEDYRELASQVERATGGLVAGSASRAKRLAETVLAYAENFPHRYRLLWRAEQLDLDDQQLADAMERLYSLLLAATGSEDSTSSSTTRSMALWSLIHGYASLRIEHFLDHRTDEETGQPRLDAMIDQLFT